MIAAFNACRLISGVLLPDCGGLRPLYHPPRIGDCAIHVDVIRAARPGDVEGCAMVDRRSPDRHPRAAAVATAGVAGCASAGDDPGPAIARAASTAPGSQTRPQRVANALVAAIRVS